MKIVISKPSLILDAQIAVGKEQSRPYLTGFCIEKASEGLILVSTDGHRLIALHDPEGTIDDDCRPIIKLPKHFLDEIKKTKKKNSYDGVYVVIDGKPGDCTASLSNDEKSVILVHDVLIDWTFPDWRKVLPKIDMGKPFVPANFNADYLGQFKALSKDRDPALIKLYGNDDTGPHLVKIQHRDDVIAVLMPCRNLTEATFPAWLDKK